MARWQWRSESKGSVKIIVRSLVSYRTTTRDVVFEVGGALVSFGIRTADGIVVAVVVVAAVVVKTEKKLQRTADGVVVAVVVAAAVVTGSSSSEGWS